VWAHCVQCDVHARRRVRCRALGVIDAATIPVRCECVRVLCMLSRRSLNRLPPPSLSVAVCAKEGVRAFGPELPSPPLFEVCCVGCALFCALCFTRCAHRPTPSLSTGCLPSSSMPSVHQCSQRHVVHARVVHCQLMRCLIVDVCNQVRDQCSVFDSLNNLFRMARTKTQLLNAICNEFRTKK
jgi:hypothetical protein